MVDAELELLPRLIANAAELLPDIESPVFGEFFDRFADARVVLSGFESAWQSGRDGHRPATNSQMPRARSSAAGGS